MEQEATAVEHDGGHAGLLGGGGDVLADLLRGIDITRARVAALEALTTDYDAVVLAAGTGVLDLLAPDTFPCAQIAVS